MSNEFAIAAVTLALRNLLDKIKDITDSDEFAHLPLDATPTAEILVTNLPLDEAYESKKPKNQVNLFLYHVEHSAAWRNMDMPNRVKPGETGHAPLAINLYYIITTYGQDGSELIAHLLLGKAMSLLHDHAVFGRTEIRNAFAVSGLHEQIERVRITPQPISLEEVSKLWTGFQTQYRLSAAYQVSVVLIDSKRPSITPLPVLTRGGSDEGVVVQPDLIPPFPTLQEVVLPPRQFSAQLNDVLTLRGFHLDGDTVEVRFLHPRLTAGITRPPEPGSDAKQVMVKIPDVADDPQAPAQWPPGFYTVAVVITKGGVVRATNELSFMLAPRIEGISPTTAAPGDFPLQVTCLPQVRPEQRVALLFGSREISVEPVSLPASPSTPTTLNFQIESAEVGTYFVRLRVDGVDSLLVKYVGTPPMPVFDSNQKVEVS